MGRAKGLSGDLSKFGEYLRKHEIDRNDIAEIAGVTASYISMLAHGKAKPGFRRAVAIERYTTANVAEPFRCVDWDEAEAA